MIYYFPGSGLLVAPQFHRLRMGANGGEKDLQGDVNSKNRKKKKKKKGKREGKRREKEKTTPLLKPSLHLSFSFVISYSQLPRSKLQREEGTGTEGTLALGTHCEAPSKQKSDFGHHSSPPIFFNAIASPRDFFSFLFFFFFLLSLFSCISYSLVADHWLLFCNRSHSVASLLFLPRLVVTQLAAHFAPQVSCLPPPRRPRVLAL